MRKIKFKIKNKEHSKIIQHILFDIGIKWNSTKKFDRFPTPMRLDEPYLFISESGYITSSQQKETYINSTHDEVELIEPEQRIFLFKLKELINKPSDKTYGSEESLDLIKSVLEHGLYYRNDSTALNWLITVYKDKL